ncbi:MAG: KpsF/GutQ family sugar-phosphate isomerase [Arenicellales bacterium]|jgi:arabinose-5-phosphate isomerase|nr:KpsF/GutQ family sugar-phosphate isomerase [Arenicellales bacterium]MED5228577.1 KpsF/GutQ family sugar-phosphate isomerase [Pseudomonadota bacterium]MDP6413314.1 KpsF/GutQ family sugar-phosphate isomerase [Arenicellales bacterium]MDP6767264.1 KpsF/GutQ family sugar-phosphate isomerase [Arenicellales bacterium]MDP7451622.1 KpsF/GutQ family sugar-phosphate isomerase [Arenicellales bacterium]|tara:strand:+ start:6388 stop:7359 length:972 start_codon:yes stop_codon:yes gene_type:complete
MNKIDFTREGREVLSLESRALGQLADRLDARFSRACELLLACEGRVIVVGMGKSGHIGGKIAATLASTGTPAFFVHPGEASHGDLGMITPGDLVIAISNSGETPEILALLPIIKRMGIPLIAMTGQAASTLGNTAVECLDTSVDKEACPHNLAPTASTTATLGMGDALAVAVLKSRGFSRDDFARSHPGGTLGRRLLIYVRDVMHTHDDMPLVTSGSQLTTALEEMSAKGLGMTGIVNAEGHLIGIYTDGDVRRSINQSIDVQTTVIDQVMVSDPRSTTADALAAEVVQLMRQHSINGLFAVDPEQRPIGALNALDLMRAGIF